MDAKRLDTSFLTKLYHPSLSEAIRLCCFRIEEHPMSEVVLSLLYEGLAKIIRHGYPFAFKVPTCSLPGPEPYLPFVEVDVLPLHLE
jgi:hypothetical protein